MNTIVNSLTYDINEYILEETNEDGCIITDTVLISFYEDPILQLNNPMVDDVCI